MKKNKVLLIEDSPHLRDIYRMMLEIALGPQGEVLEATTVADAKAIFSNHVDEIGLVITDMDLSPDKDGGVRILYYIKAVTNGVHPPVILSSGSDPEELAPVLPLFNGFIAKPAENLMESFEVLVKKMMREE